MTTFQRLKHEARKAEQRSDWRKAIALYREAMRYDEQQHGIRELGLFNRIGDLHIRLGEIPQAVECYEQAADRYAENELPTSAIALCNKILRVAPDRTDVFRRLSLLHATTGLLAEARSALLQYVDRMERDRSLGSAFEAVQEFVGITGDDTIRVHVADLLAERGHSDQAQAQLRLAADASQRRGLETEELEERIEQLRVPEPAVPVRPDGRDATGEAPPEPEEAATVRLGDRVRAALSGFDSAGPSTGPTASWAASDQDAAVPDLPPGPVAEALRRFRARVQPELDRTGPELRYDLGVAFQTMELDAAALEEFRYGIAAAGRVRATNDRITRILHPVGPPEQADPLEPTAPHVPEPEVPPIAVPELELPDPNPASFELEPAPNDLPEDTSLEPDLQGLLFRARLAQHQIRRGQDSGRMDFRSYLELGNAYAEMGLRDEAIRELFEAAAGPNPIGSRAVAALFEITRNPETDWEQAISVIERLRELGHSDAAGPVLHELLGRWGEDHPGAGRLGELLGWVVTSARALEAPEVPEPVIVDSSSLEVLDQLLDQLDDGSIGTVMPESDEDSDPMHALEAADRMAAAGREEEAISHLYRALERFENAREIREATAVVDRLLELRPDDVVLHHQRAEFALTLNDRNLLLSSYMSLAASLRRQNALGNARTVYARILDIDADHVEARAALEQLSIVPPHGNLREVEPGRAPGDAGESMTGRGPRLPHVPEDREEFDTLLGELRDPGPDADAFEGDPDAHFELGIAFKQMEMWEEAIAELDRAASGMSDPIRVWEVKAECLERAGRTDEAVELQYQLAVALQECGDSAGAVRYFRRVVDTDGSFRDAATRLSALSP